MKKELSISRLFIDSLSFIGGNFGLLCFLAFLSFLGSYIALWAGTAHNFLYLLIYGIFIYAFYYVFAGLYFEKKPLWTAQSFVNSFIKLITITTLSFLILVLCRLGINIARHLIGGLAIFPDFYSWLRHIYHLILNSGAYTIILYLGTICLLTFSFFIPGFAWLASINNSDASIISAYTNVRGSYFKTIIVFVLLYGILPLIIGFIGLLTSRTVLSVLYAAQTIFQLVIYLHLYDFFYLKQEQ